MLGLTELEQTRAYQEGKQEGKQEGELLLILRQLVRRLGSLSPEIQSRIEALSLEQIEALGEDLLDFSEMTDLETWLSRIDS